MIIFGYRGMAKLLGMVTLVCQNCHNPAAHRIVRHMRWFTLFFIPVIPLSIKRTMTCTFCGVTTKISKEQAEQIVPSQTAAPQPLGPGAEQIAAPQHPNHQYPNHQYPDQQDPTQQDPRLGGPQPGYPQQQYPPHQPPAGPQQ